MNEINYRNNNEDREIQEIIGTNNILYNNRVIKLNKYNISREVDFIITPQRIYILKRKSI